MHVFFGDESNVSQDKSAVFFIYGGLIIDAERALDASKDVIAIRQKYGFGPNDEFKFDTRSKPINLAPDGFAQAKNEVLAACKNHGVVFMAYAVHHSIADVKASGGGPSGRIKEETRLWALKTLLCQFDLFLQREKSHGICLVDRFNGDFSVLKDIHQDGVDPDSGNGRLSHRLDNIWCYGTMGINTSHVASLVDIVLGSFRYCVNKVGKETVHHQLYGSVRPLILCEPGSPAKVEEWGLFLRPRQVKSSAIKLDYDSLLEQLKSLE